MSVEILAPAGNKECFNAAINAGADAIYIGLDEFSARKSAENFSIANLEENLKKAHLFGIKVYIAVNTLVKDTELERFLEVIKQAYKLGADAFILQDMFLGKELKKIMPEINLHLSTQAGVCNEYGALLAREYGFSRVILARETTFEDTKKIAEIIETETFIHGALCSSFSGHCYMSSFAGGNSGNRGYCKQPCRKFYTYKGEGFSSFKGYNLSLADLCVCEDINRLKDIGVSSFKIEGRMRSPEYVYYAVMYYRDLLKGRNNSKIFSKLTRTYNRGDFTKGYSCGNMRDIISRKIQGNIGDFIGFITTIKNGVAYIKTAEQFERGDGFKIIRNGVEVGSGSFHSCKNGALFLSINENIKVGDEVRITKDRSLNDDLNSAERKLPIEIKLAFDENVSAKATLIYNNKIYNVYSDFNLEAAKNAPLKKEHIIDCFSKTDNIPFAPKIEIEILNNVFVPKGQLNAFRRKCYCGFYDFLTDCFDRKTSDIIFQTNILSDKNNGKNAVIICDFTDFNFCNADIVIYRPYDYNNLVLIQEFLSISNGKCKRFLYIPPYANSEDIKIIRKSLYGFDGVYAEGYYGILLAREFGIRLFCGSGFNIFNRLDVLAVKEIDVVDDFCYSKELSLKEITEIGGDGFIFNAGNIQVMDLIYCPFSMNCDSCNRGNIYNLTDEDKRNYIVRRYKISKCMFEVYNPYNLNSKNDKTRNFLIDATLFEGKDINNIYTNNQDMFMRQISNDGYTYGHLKRGVK